MMLHLIALLNEIVVSASVRRIFEYVDHKFYVHLQL